MNHTKVRGSVLSYRAYKMLKICGMRWLMPTKNTKISQAWQCAPVVPATQEAETGEAEVVVSRHCATALQPGQKSETPSQKKKKPSSIILPNETML